MFMSHLMLIGQDEPWGTLSGAVMWVAIIGLLVAVIFFSFIFLLFSTLLFELQKV